ncbi:ABC transporter ATP-binding protein [Sporosarcina sp. P21c]|uniref:ABC transporter ATP-binding protein n=1 Tax=Sporosarcina TaxID=1569 RepID=UPI000A166134|nr:MULTISPECIES: dipeptide/oligopeptide/nickel ABC transporter ATP-binding protein [Sporosarcina]ARJ37627.1 peptide ABC transporter ATP-binding protein [Sporosarcina ureae]PIC67208.1 ABC transporter ATP-binding protein [Sporosarcina sp. P16a]PIC89499.1 ABC transporter ATP-binding protein [Sporosarcina sp. P21c]PIC92659.1 ABC transporter ATP-binding protein [Sporosarcina sp. P25]
MLEVSNVSKSYYNGRQTKKALNGIDLTVSKGEVVGLVGESGCGKSTLARVVMQLELADSGSIAFNGKLVTRKSRKSFYQASQLIFQNASAALNPSWTVREILLEPLRLMKGDREAYIRRMLGRVKLSETHLHRYPSQLSGGEQQRVNLLRSLLVEPDLLICDEIVSNLDRLTQREIIDLLLELNREMDMSILFIAHDLQAVMYACDRIYVMKDGRVVDESAKTDGVFYFSHCYARQLFASVLGNRMRE